MKYIAIGLLALVSGWVQAEFHEFNTPDGKTVKAEILGIRNGQVELKREGGKRVAVNPSIFVEEDQQYIQKWASTEGVRSEAKFRISCERRMISNWTEEELGRITYTDGGSEDNQVVGRRHFEEVGYDIVVQNKNQFPVDGVELEYCIFYEQDEGKGEVPGVRYGKIDLGQLPSQDSKELPSETVVVYKYETHSYFINSKVWKGDVDGIIVRICSKDDGSILREVAVPSGITKSHVWQGKSNHVGVNRINNRNSKAR